MSSLDETNENSIKAIKRNAKISREPQISKHVEFITHTRGFITWHHRCHLAFLISLQSVSRVLRRPLYVRPPQQHGAAAGPGSSAHDDGSAQASGCFAPSRANLSASSLPTNPE